MRVRKHGIAAFALAAATLVTFGEAHVARAQGASAPIAVAEAVAAPAALQVEAVQAGASSTVGALGLDHLFSPPAVIDQAWARAVEAVVDGMRHLVDAERIEAVQAVGGPCVPPLAPARAKHRAPPLRFVPAWRAAWAPGQAVRDALAAAPVQPKPLPVEPPTETGVDTRGEHAVLLGVSMELPWRVP